MSDNELDALFWKLVITSLIVLIVFCSTASITNTTKINDTLGRMVTEGINPKKAGCAIAIANNRASEAIRIYCAIPE